MRPVKRSNLDLGAGATSGSGRCVAAPCAAPVARYSDAYVATAGGDPMYGIPMTSGARVQRSR